MSIATVHYLSMLKLHDFTLTYSGQTTTALSRTATSTQVANALKALSNIGDNDVSVSGSNGGPYTITFSGALAATDVPLLTSNRAAITITTSTPGATATNEVQTVTVVATGGTFTLTYEGQTTSDIAYNATSTEVATALKALSNIGDNDVTVSGSAGGPYTVTFVGALAATNVAALTASASGLTGTNKSVTIATPTQGTGNVNEVQVVTLPHTS